MSWRPLRAPRGRLIPALLIRSPFPPFGKRPSVVPRKTRSRSFPFPRLAASACASTGPPPPNLSTWIVRRRIRRNLSGFPAPLYSTKGSWPWISSSRWIVRSTPSIRCPPRRGGAPLDEGFSTNLQVGQVGENKTRSGRRIGGCGYRGSERRPRQRIRCADGGATSVLAADVICQIG